MACASSLLDGMATSAKFGAIILQYMYMYAFDVCDAHQHADALCLHTRLPGRSLNYLVLLPSTTQFVRELGAKMGTTAPRRSTSSIW